MSIAQQTAFLKAFDKLLNQRVATYRAKNANKVSHVFVASRVAVRRGILDLLRKQLTNIDKKNEVIGSILAAADPFITKFIDDVKRAVDANFRSNSVVVGKITKYQPGNRLVAFFAATEIEEGHFRNVYQQITRTYKQLIEALADDVADVTKTISGKTVSSQAKDFWNLEHANLQGIAESQVRDAMTNSLLEEGIEGAIGEDDVMKWLQDSNIDLRIVRDTKTNKMLVFIGSKQGNMIEALNSKQRKKVLKELVDGARKQVEQQGERILGLPGSPSFIDLKRKETVKRVIGSIKKKNPRAKVKLAENLDIRGSKTDVSTKKKTKNKSVGPMLSRAASAPTAPNRRVQKGVSSSPLTLIKMINARLPRTVAANMGAPALENRTGRFASSARVVEATTTAKGFTSFGYTYQRDPYGVFESTSGTRFASPERDPRVLIEGSIREIAQELAIGRFFTRRV
tara:strand:- start:866 stop:2233 length:1368 start_codon:yes stop_codon:yes gene_type:complete